MSPLRIEWRAHSAEPWGPLPQAPKLDGQTARGARTALEEWCRRWPATVGHWRVVEVSTAGVVQHCHAARWAVGGRLFVARGEDTTAAYAVEVPA